MEDYTKIINWDNFFKNSGVFQNNKPYRFAFIEEALDRNFYEKLYQTYPKFDETWKHYQDISRSSRNKVIDLEKFLSTGKSTLGKEWDMFLHYLTSKEFVENYSKFTGVKLEKIVTTGFINSHKGDFSLPHIDGYMNKDGSTNFKIQTLLYFNKGWQKGDPGGTYICSDEDESTIIFEPCNLDNSLVIFEQSPNAWHGSRYITKDVRRQAMSFQLV